MTPISPAADAPMTAKERLFLATRGLLLVLAIGLAAVAIVNSGPPLEPGTSPTVQLRSYDGQSWDLSRFAGKPVVLNFWATWCAPCMQELPHFARSAEAHSDEVVFVGAAVSSPRQEVFHTIERFGIRYPIAEPSPAMIQAWHARGLPSTYFLDAEHRVVWSQGGMLTAEELEEALSTHLGVGG